MLNGTVDGFPYFSSLQRKFVLQVKTKFDNLRNQAQKNGIFSGIAETSKLYWRVIQRNDKKIDYDFIFSKYTVFPKN